MRLGRTSCRVNPSQEQQCSRHLASGLVLSTLPGIASRPSLSQSSSLLSLGPSGAHSSLLQLGYWGEMCPWVPLPLSSSYLEEGT